VTKQQRFLLLGCACSDCVCPRVSARQTDDDLGIPAPQATSAKANTATILPLVRGMLPESIFFQRIKSRNRSPKRKRYRRNPSRN